MNVKNLILKDGRCVSCGRTEQQHKASVKKKNPTWDRIKYERRGADDASS